MVLNDREINDLCEESMLWPPLIRPFDEKRLQPASYDLTLGNHFKVKKTNNDAYIDLAKVKDVEWQETSVEEWVMLAPHTLVLATTQECVDLPSGIQGQVFGKSSLARLGLFIHTCAGFIDPGFSGEITLELYNVANIPMKLYVGMPIAQISFAQLVAPAHNPYGKDRNHYQYQVGATESRYELE